ncbi:MAG: hypothetical protein ACLR8Y_09610 [Alistipes indistinctus]
MMVRTLPVRCHLGKEVTTTALIDEMNAQRKDTRQARSCFRLPISCR